MKKTLFWIASLSICLMACNKIDSEAPENPIDPETHEVTLKADIQSDPETRANYEIKGTGLKCTWASGDKITLVTYNADDHSSTLATIDNLTLASGSGKTSGTFTGTITGTPGAYYIVVYPAVTQTETPPYKSAQIPKDVPASQSRGSVVTIEQGNNDLLLVLKVEAILMAAGSKTNVKHLNNCPMVGHGTVFDGVLSSTVLEQECSVMKLHYTLPDFWADKTLYSIYLNWTISSTDQAPFANQLIWKLGKNGQYAGLYNPAEGLSGRGPVLFIGHHWDADYTPVRPAGYNVDDFGPEMILYYPYLAPQEKAPFPQSLLCLYGQYQPGTLDYYELARKEVSSGKFNERGKVYTINF